MAAQIDELGERVRIHEQQRVVGREIGVAVARDAHQAVDVVGDGAELASLRVLQPNCILLRNIAKVVADHKRDGIAEHGAIGSHHPAEEAQQRRVVGLGGDGLHRATRATSGEGLGSVEQIGVELALEAGGHAL